MSNDSDPTLSHADLLTINECCDEFEQSWRNWRQQDFDDTKRPKLETLVAGKPAHLRPALVRELAAIEMEYRNAAGETLRLQEFVERFDDVDSGIFINLLQESVSDIEAIGNREADSTNPNANGSRESEASFSYGSPADSSAETPRQIGQYEIVRVLGTGGMGTVYQAVHREMQRDVALKVMRSDLTDQESLKKRFRREVLAAAKLVHPNIVTAYDAGETKSADGSSGQPFLVSELVDGVDLRHQVRQHGILSVEDALNCVRNAATGLDYAHQHEVIHRDIKPANLLLGKSGNVKILDMGLARLSLSAEESSGKTGLDGELTAQLTSTGAVMGTAGYMAPEQARNTKSADARSDVYSLGCVLFYLLQGRAPYRGESIVDTILSHATEPIPELETKKGCDPIPESVKSLVRKMMAKSPEHRPQTMADVILEINQITGSKITGPQPVDGKTTDGKTTDGQTIGVAPASLGKMSPVPPPAPPKIRSDSGKQHAWVPLIASLAIAAGAMMAIVSYFGSDNPQGGPQNDDPRQSRNQTFGPSNNASQANRGVRFSGQDSYLSVPSIKRGPGNVVTLELITRREGSNGAMNPLCWLGDDWTTIYHSGQWGIGRFEKGESLFAACPSHIESPVNQWEHVAGTWDGEELSLFIDGQPIEPHGLNFKLEETTAGLFIGGVDPGRLPRDQSQRFYIGVIDAVRIVERVVYPPGESFTPPTRFDVVPQTLALYQFDEPAGSQSFEDSSGNGHTAISRNAESVALDE